LARFRRYFGNRIAVWHSALNDGERLSTWLKIRNGEPVILIGTRSAVLLPFTGLRAIIVDEEHDSSYKQGEGFRYSGRDVAVYRGHLNQCPVRSEERRVGKECRARWSAGHYKKKKTTRRNVAEEQRAMNE